MADYLKVVVLGKLINLFGDSNDKQIKRFAPTINAVNSLEKEYIDLTDDELRESAGKFRLRYEDGDPLDELLPEVFAATREAARRTIGLRHYDVQLIGGIVLHQGKVAEMKTGEGKTLVATLALALNALPGTGSHLVTVNDYLARRDSVWMGPVYHALGFTVGCLQHEEAFIYDPTITETGIVKYAALKPASRQEAYSADITYGTNNEFGFDYLRDNMVVAPERLVQRNLSFGIVDEVDNILIDEARTPLIVSGPAQESTKLYATCAQLVTRLKEDEDYRIEEKERVAILTDDGMNKLEKALAIDNLYAQENYGLIHFLENALRAQVIFRRDRDYVVNNGEVLIVDEFTGRLMQGRRFADGLHQALEAKEKVQVRQESVTYATITIQNYFRMYQKLSGMTGTAMTEAEEFSKVYRLEVVTIPTHKEVIRDDLPDYIFKSEHAKFTAVVDEIAEMNRLGRPVLVGTVSIDRSEQLSDMLRKRGIDHEVLNAKQHDREALIIAQAGSPGAVTVATNMAGRGTDIVLGGDPSSVVSDSQWQTDHETVVKAGGLYVIGTERHESRRIDNQLRGRCGRQGDPGTTRFYGSLEDDLIKRFGGDRIKSVMDWVGMPDAVPLESRMVGRIVENTQTKVEAFNFDIRKRLLEYDDVVNTQRNIIYSERLKPLNGGDLQEDVSIMLENEIRTLISEFLPGESTNWDIDAFLDGLATMFPEAVNWDIEYFTGRESREIGDDICSFANEFLKEREEQLGEEVVRALERGLMLQVIDRLWINHLTAMQNLREGIGLHAFGQRDPLMMYKKEGHNLFNNLLSRIQHDVAHAVSHFDSIEQPNGANPRRSNNRSANTSLSNLMKPQVSISPSSGGPISVAAKIGRNDLCPCGSGKKYKRCHGVT